MCCWLLLNIQRLMRIDFDVVRSRTLIFFGNMWLPCCVRTSYLPHKWYSKLIYFLWKWWFLTKLFFQNFFKTNQKNECSTSTTAISIKNIFLLFLHEQQIAACGLKYDRPHQIWIFFSWWVWALTLLVVIDLQTSPDAYLLLPA